MAAHRHSIKREEPSLSYALKCIEITPFYSFAGNYYCTFSSSIFYGDCIPTDTGSSDTSGRKGGYCKDDLFLDGFIA
jgi:hypothetical protein